ncbi:MAG: HAD-IIA family hydrolase [Candidatus Bipolaricaulota bacterium]|nr:HAD-IIA family hydrolase [Candidatus Bipolaricaulota bacterium]
MINGYLLDLDGTVYLGERLITGATETIAALRKRGRRLVFLTNKPLYSRADYAHKLTRLGIETSEDEVINSSFVLARYLAESAPGAHVYAIGEPPLLAELERAGLALCDDPEKIEYVIAAFDRTFTYEKLNIGFQAIRRGSHFVATNPDRTCPVEQGEIPDAAGVIAALEATTGKKVEVVVGKPSRHTVDVAIDRLGVTREECAMIGDRLETDMRMARDAGLTGILTLSGVTSRADLAVSKVEPNYVIESIAALAELDAKLN